MKKPLGVGFVSTCEILLGSVSGFIGLMFLVDSFYGLLHVAWARVALSLGIALMMTAIATACIYIGAAFWRGARWAWKASWAIGLLVGVPTVHFVYFSSQPWRNERGGVATLMGILFFMLVALGWTALLVSSTRRFFARAGNPSGERL